MSTAFSIPEAHACQPGWHGTQRLAAALSISPRVLAPRFPGEMFDEGNVLHVGQRQGEDGKESRTFTPQRDRTNTQAAQFHHCCNVVLGRLRDGKMAPRRTNTPTKLPSQPTPPAQMGGQLNEGNRKEQGHSLLFHPRNCQASTPPQLATDSFLPAALRHTPLCQCLVQKCGGWKKRKWV